MWWMQKCIIMIYIKVYLSTIIIIFAEQLMMMMGEYRGVPLTGRSNNKPPQI